MALRRDGAGSEPAGPPRPGGSRPCSGWHLRWQSGGAATAERDGTGAGGTRGLALRPLVLLDRREPGSVRDRIRAPARGGMMASNLDEKFQTLQEIVKAARQNLAPGRWDYLVGSAETDPAMRRNRQALDSIAFRPRVLRDVSRIDCTSTLLGRRVRLPVMLAPVGSIESFDPGGGASAARGAVAFGVPQMLSSV